MSVGELTVTGCGAGAEDKCRGHTRAAVPRSPGDVLPLPCGSRSSARQWRLLTSSVPPARPDRRCRSRGYRADSSLRSRDGCGVCSPPSCRSRSRRIRWLLITSFLATGTRCRRPHGRAGRCGLVRCGVVRGRRIGGPRGARRDGDPVVTPAVTSPQAGWRYGCHPVADCAITPGSARQSRPDRLRDFDEHLVDIVIALRSTPTIRRLQACRRPNRLARQVPPRSVVESVEAGRAAAGRVARARQRRVRSRLPCPGAVRDPRRAALDAPDGG
jgi:hypothetical protein